MRHIVSPNARTEPRLAEILEAGLAATQGLDNTLKLVAGRNVAVVAVDGLGLRSLRARSGHARTLTRTGRLRTAISGFPATTVAGLGSLATGLSSGEHGLVGYLIRDPVHDRLVNQLSGWDARMVPEQWQPRPTLFERASSLGVTPYALGPAKYRTSGFSRAILRGATYIGIDDIEERMLRMASLLRSPKPTLVYLYHPDLDMTAHAKGWESAEWTTKLEEFDHALSVSLDAVTRGTVIVTADHGVVDVPRSEHLYVDDLVRESNVRFVGGDPRCLQLYLVGSTHEAAAVAEHWRSALSERWFVATKAQAVIEGWFGTVEPEHLARIGDVLVGAATPYGALYDRASAKPTSLNMIGQHGAFTPEEQEIPLLVV